MQFVPEEAIDATAEKLGAEINFDELILDFKARQPALMAYLFSDDFDLLNQEEREYLLFLSLVIWKACEDMNPGITVISTDQLEEQEEVNWEILLKSTAKKFNERIDPFFENYQQEDLLAFVEDALAIDEETEVTKEGREYIFVALKTMIDCIHAAK